MQKWDPVDKWKIARARLIRKQTRAGNDLRMRNTFSRFLFFPLLVRINLVVESSWIFGERLLRSYDSADFTPGAVVGGPVVVVKLEQLHLPLDRRSRTDGKNRLDRNDLHLLISVRRCSWNDRHKGYYNLFSTIINIVHDRPHVLQVKTHWGHVFEDFPGLRRPLLNSWR